MVWKNPCSQRFFAKAGQGGCNGQSRIGVFCPDVPAVTRNRAPGDGQAQPVTSGVAGAGSIGAIEGLEYFLQLRLGYPATLVGDTNAVAVSDAIERYRDRRIVRCVGQGIAQDIFKAFLQQIAGARHYRLR